MPLVISGDPIAHLIGEGTESSLLGIVLLRIVLSLVLSAIIGYERSTKRHSAGLRTFIVVSLACTIAMILDLFLDRGFCLLSAAALVGLATITVNSIVFSARSRIKGLTTSVGLWASGIVGFAVGAGLYTVTLISFVTLLFVLSWLPALERYLKDKSNHFEIHLELNNICYLKDFVTTIRELGLTIDDIESNPAYANSGLSVYSIAITIHSKELKKYKKHSEIIKALSTLEYVYHIEEMR
jgi:putative Mg2+ transporter-C (MgtC) family protein